jgi:hypothetical protein
MADKSPDNKIPLTLHLPEDLAKRLQLAATSRKRPAAELVLDLLDRHLPQSGGEQRKGKIPYA